MRMSLQTLALFGLLAGGVAMVLLQVYPHGKEGSFPASSWAERIGAGADGAAPAAAGSTLAAAPTDVQANGHMMVDAASCAQAGGDAQSCTLVIDMVTIAHIAGEPLVDTQIGPLIAALTQAEADLSAGADKTEPGPIDSGSQIVRLRRGIADMHKRNASLTHAAARVLTDGQLENLDSYLDEKREAMQIDLDVALENAANGRGAS